MKEIQRPVYHFTPPVGWTNDPNGTLYCNGEYHLFYQHHPHSLQWGPMHWGHAVSRDLLRWEHLPIALAPDDLGMVFSGSAVLDEGNTSGFGSAQNPPIVAAYTSHADAERQSIAYSVDGGRTFAKYDGNPVVSEPGRKDFRDPRVIRHEPTSGWIMVVASGDRARLYRSQDLKHWEFASEIGPVAALGDAVWECPDLFPLPFEGGEKWVFSLSTTTGGPGGGNGVMYFTGDFDGYTYRIEGGPRLADWGRDFYAPITFSGAPGRQVWVGWQACWAYAGETPAEGWRGMMSLPRELALVRSGATAVLAQNPAQEFLDLQRIPLYRAAGAQAGHVRNVVCADCGPVFEISGALEGSGALSVGLFGCLNISIDCGAGEAGVERIAGANACAHALFSGEVLTAPLDASQPCDFRIVADTNAVEIFLQGGRAVLSALAYPLDDNRSAILQMQGDGRLSGLTVNQIHHTK